MNFHSVYVGDGKTHYIKEQMKTSKAKLTIAVNEAFTPLKAITKLCGFLSTNDTVWMAAIFFNFTMFSPGVCEIRIELIESV